MFATLRGFRVHIIEYFMLLSINEWRLECIYIFLSNGVFEVFVSTLDQRNTQMYQNKDVKNKNKNGVFVFFPGSFLVFENSRTQMEVHFCNQKTTSKIPIFVFVFDRLVPVGRSEINSDKTDFEFQKLFEIHECTDVIIALVHHHSIY